MLILKFVVLDVEFSALSDGVTFIEGHRTKTESTPKMNYKIIQNLYIVYLYILLLFTHDFCHLSLYNMYNIYIICIDII